MVEAQEEVNNSGQMIKGKRTKRQRPLSPLALTMASCSSTSTSASPTTSIEFAESTEEEEDMANCLILLARGHTTKNVDPEPAVSTMTMMSSGTSNKGTGLYVYQCKTCDRCFPSFQALGGHRASHKKPKAANSEEKNKGFFFMEEDHHDHFNNAAATTLSLQISNTKGLISNFNNGHSKTKLHECAICGAEFTSGQALGGHMRRHRTFIHTAPTTTSTMSVGTSSPESTQESKKAAARNINLQLDLNLPAAPEDDRRETKFPFASKEKVIVFSASPLVDCHY